MVCLMIGDDDDNEGVKAHDDNNDIYLHDIDLQEYS